MFCSADTSQKKIFWKHLIIPDPVQPQLEHPFQNTNMAVEVNKRKRKHNDENPDEDEGVVAVPKKKEKKAKQVEASADDSQQDSGFEPEEKPIKFSKDFNMTNFRSKLRGVSFITELRHFLYLCGVRPKTIAKYIEKRGKPLEFAEALERIDKTNVLHASYICEALYLVLMEILGNQRNHMESAVHASRYFLKSHGAILELLLESAQFNHRKIALKLLTAFVCIEPQLGRQILSSYDILSNKRTIVTFLSHSPAEVKQIEEAKGEETETVRKCFIHFVLSYLVDGNTLLIRNILDRNALISALVCGLEYDDSVTVCVVLSTLKKYVLECPEISKTKKIHVFDAVCCKALVWLYDWKGPKFYAEQNKRQLKRHRNYGHLVNPDEKEAVSRAVHDFLVVLLTSRKYGIAFDTITYFRQKHNTIQGQVIGFLKLSWENDLKKDLILKILENCPDLFRNTVRNFAGVINPNSRGNEAWIRATYFLIDIINACHPRYLKGALDKITITDFSYWIKDICLPIETLVHLNGSELLKNLKIEFRLASVRLLLAMFKQYTNYMKVILQREQKRAAGSNTLRKFKFDILNHLLLHFPPIEKVLNSLELSIKVKDTNKEDVLSHLDAVLDLILLLCQENDSFVNKTSTILDYLELLRPLYAGEQNASPENVKLEMKAIKTILWISPKSLDPQTDQFSTVLASLIKGFVHGEIQTSQEAGILLRTIFKNTGIFDSGELEIDFWLEALKFIPNESVQLVTQVFIEVFKVLKADVECPKTVETVTNTKNLHALFENIEKGLSVQAYSEALSISKLMPLIFKGVLIGNELSKYLEIVCILMFHYYPAAENVLKLYEQQFKELKPYMQSWLSTKIAEERKLLAKSDTFKQIIHFSDIQQMVLKCSQDFEKIFESKSSENFVELEFKGHTKKFSPIVRNERLLMIYIQHVLFHVDKLMEKTLLTEPQAVKSAEFIIDCLEVITKSSSQEDSSAALYSADAETCLNCIVKYIFNVKLNSIKSGDLINSTIASVSYRNYLKFIRDLTEYCNKLECFDNYAENFKLKLVKASAISINEAIEVTSHSEQLEEFVHLLKTFKLSANHCGEILDTILFKMTYKDLFINQQKTFFYSVIVACFQRLAELKKTLNGGDFIKKFSKIYSNIFKKLEGDYNVENLEEAFYNFLLINHQFIQDLGSKFFESFFMERKLSKYSIKLCCLLFERNPNLEAVFVEQLESNIDKKELIYPLLSLAFAKNTNVDASLMQKIYQNYKNGFMRCIEKPLKAGVIYKENVESSIKLIEQCMPVTECRDFCNKQFKFENIETYQMRSIYAIYEKAFRHVEEMSVRSNIFVNFVTLSVQMLSLDLKMQKLNQEKLDLAAYQIDQWFKHGLRLQAKSQAESEDSAEYENQFSPDFSKLLKSQQWLQFCKSCLKTGMHISEAVVEGETEDIFNGLLLKLLAHLCENLYVDYSEDIAESEVAQEPAQLYEMIYTHSKFFDIVLTKSQQSKVKTQVLHLLFTLAKKCPAALNEKQIPIILGSYQARLSDSDRYALALLNLFEYYDCGLHKYRPFIWGESAVAFYSLRTDVDERAKLTQQETSIEQVMSLVDRQICEYTIDNFPIWRKLDTLQQLPEVEFENPFIRPWLFGANDLEKKVEIGDNEIAEQELRLCPKRKDIFEQCYDPAFFVPLMSMCFAPETYSHPARPVQNGLLALTFAALSSQDKDMRLASGCVQLRYRSHFENKKFFEKPLWIQTYENIQSGLNDLRNSWMKHKSNKGTPRVPYIAGLFVAKTFNLTTDPTHLLYKQLTMYLRLKSSFNFQCIPEFNVLFFSPEVEHEQFRKFIVEVIRNGVKSSSDLFLLVSTNTFKVLMGFYGSTMSTLELNLLILSVFSTCVKIPASSKIMIEHIGVIPWLCSIVSSIEFHQFDVIEGLISIINNLWYALKANEKEFHNFNHVVFELHRLIVQLLPLLSPRISISNFSKLMNILNKTALDSSQYYALTSDQLSKLIGCAEKHFGSLVASIESIFEYGGNGCSSIESYCKELYDLGENSTTIRALSSLRAYTIAWWSVCKRCDHSETSVPRDEVVRSQ
ncbi:nucleolar pre-ribosomal-associated protein 1 isoform X2 [Musca autumnalis]|uniref:nucleolar pre-ribosomal-associated protein 1 isoform X2 n=1 Tax=Musca autumnalis TaxID=221902 RepID=UPI003CF03857